MESSLDTLADLLRRPEFHTGLIAGIVGWVVVRTLSTRGLGWGISLAAATIVGVNVIVAQRLSTAAGLALLAVGGGLLERNQDRPDAAPLPWLIIVAGAILTTVRGGLPETTWIQFLAPVLIVASGYWMAGWASLPQRQLLGPLVAVTAFGIWSTVPDTDIARILLGAAIPLAFATVTARGLRLSAVGAFPLAGTLIWVAATGGEGRHASIVGAWACVGILVLLPLLASRAAQISPWVVTGSHMLLVLVSARIFGLWESAGPAAVGVAAAIGLAYMGLVAFTDQPGVTNPTSMER